MSIFRIHFTGPWREWFAWHPVHLTEGGWAWLEHVYRREETDHYFHTRTSYTKAPTNE